MFLIINIYSLMILFLIFLSKTFMFISTYKLLHTMKCVVTTYHQLFVKQGDDSKNT